jgi:hypothetical protein
MRHVQFDEIEDQARAFAEPVYTETTKRTKYYVMKYPVYT